MHTLSSVISDTRPERAEQKESQQPVRFLFLALVLFESFYLLLIAITPLPGLNLSGTPLAATLPWTLWPARMLQTWIGSSLAETTWLPSLLLGATFVGLLGTYAGVVFLLVRRNLQRSIYFVLGSTLLFGGTLLFLPTLFSDSVFTSIFTGRILTIYHENPLNTAPALFPKDPYLPWVISGRDSANIFGPLWVWTCALLAAVSNDLVVSLFVFKGTLLASHLLNTFIMWALLGKIAPSRRLVGTLLYGWCPLALIEIAGSGQGESIQITFLLLATWLYVLSLPLAHPNSAEIVATHQNKWKNKGIAIPKGRFRSLFQRPENWRSLLRLSALGVLGLALGANLITLLIAPLVLWYEQRHERRIPRAVLTVSWQMVLLFIPELFLMTPFWSGHGTQIFFAITSSVDMDHFVHAPVSLFTVPLRMIFTNLSHQSPQGLPPGVLPPELAADLTIRASATCVFVLIYAHLFARVRRAPLNITNLNQRSGSDPQMLIPGFDTLLDCCSIAIFWYLILVSGWFWPWYILWLLWLVVLRRIDTFTVAILLLSGTALLIYAFVGFSPAPLATYQAALIFGIPLLYLLVVRRRWKGPAERTLEADAK
jgi:hypothetical protein